MNHDNTLYDIFTGVRINALKTTDINSATGRSFVDSATTAFWNPLLLLFHVLKSSRTYAHGLPVPETGAVWTQEIADGASATVQPSGTEIWKVEGIAIDGCSVGLYDGSTICSVDTTENTPPYFITNTLYLVLQNATGSAKNPDIAYSKVGL